MLFQGRASCPRRSQNLHSRDALQKHKGTPASALKLNKHLSSYLYRRLLALFYDIIVILAFLIIATEFFFLAMEGVIKPRVLQLYLFSLIFCFFVFFWRVFGQTPGMIAWRLQLITQTGKPLSLTRVVFRFLLGLGGIIGWLWILWDKDKLPLYDRLCGTTLILKK